MPPVPGPITAAGLREGVLPAAMDVKAAVEAEAAMQDIDAPSEPADAVLFKSKLNALLHEVPSPCSF